MRNDEILDEIEQEVELSKFALKSFDQFWYSIIFYTILPIIFGFIKRFNLLNYNDFSTRFGKIFFLGSLLFGIIGFVFNYLGMQNALKSIRHNESFSWKLFIGGLGNLVLFFLWVTMVTFYLLKFIGGDRIF